MTAPLPLMTESEVRHCRSPHVDDGYGCMRTERGVLPLAEMTIDARVIATFAHTTLRQVFVNNLGAPLEATYIFPLPDRAAVTRFTMEVAGRRVEGALEERMQARRTYETAVAQGKRASIAEEERAGVFSIRVGNLMPGEHATITLELSGALPVADGEVTYRFPLVVAPRYMPGQTLGGDNVGDGTAHDTDAVPDASRISPPVLLPGMSSPVRLSISVELDSAGLPMKQVRSSLHAAYADQRAGRLIVSLPPGERLDRDFILRFHLGDEAVRTSARVLGDTFALTLLPPTVGVVDKPKDVVFVLDRSGSMEGWKMVAARRACARMIDALRAHDRFSVLAFDNVVEELRPDPSVSSGLVEASDRNRFRATELLAKVDSRGGTEMAEPLAKAADMLAGGYQDRDRVLVFVTDGQVGNEAQLMKLLGQRLKGTRIFPLGIDQAVNAAFLNKLAALGRAGTAELIESEDRLDEVLVRLHRRVDAPVIAELSVDIEGARLVGGTMAPAQLPDVFAGVPASIFGRLDLLGGNASRAAFIVRGRTADGRRFEERIPLVEVQNPAVRTAWARNHLRDLEDRFDANQGDKRALERKIVEVSLQSRVLCRFTAFVAVDHEVVNRGGYNRHVTQPVEEPAGWAGAGKGRASPSPMSPGAPRGGMAMPVSAAMPARASASSANAKSMAADDDLFEEGAGMAALDDDLDDGEMEPSMAPPPPPAARMAPAKAPAPMQAEEELRPQSVQSAGADLSRADRAEPMRRAREKSESKRDEAIETKKKSGRSGGLLGAMKDAVKEAVSEGFRAAGVSSEKSAAPVDKTLVDNKSSAVQSTLAGMFSDRLVELVELVRQRHSDLFGIARELGQRLKLLLEDMAHAGVPADDRRGLTEILKMVQDSLTSGDSISLERSLDLAEDVLDRAAGGVPRGGSPQPSTSTRRDGFWR